MTVELKALAKALTEKPDRVTSSIPAGYTYLGQMISHDLVPPTGSANNSRFTAKLDLASIYDAIAPDGFPPTTKGREWDLPRRPDQSANIPERRNDENVIIAQLHRLWQQVHETIVRFGGTQAQARNDVILLFQTLVIDDYLQRVLQPHVFEAYFRRGEKHLGFADDRVPRVFSHAGFRFGHSMVRGSYTLNSNAQGIKLSSLFRRDSAIPEAFRISWSHFFKTDPDKEPQKSMGIDTSITNFMTDVPEDNPGHVDVVLRNLQAGIGLPSGYDFVTDLLKGDNEHYPKIDPAMHLYPVANDSVQVLGLSGDKLPLFPYLLLESELQGQGNRLGVLGSLIVGEALQNAIRTACPSVFQGDVYRFNLALKRLSPACRNAIATSRNHSPVSPERIDMPTIISMANLQ